MDLASISAAITGLRFAKDTVQSFVDYKIESGSQTKVSEVLERLTAAQESIFDMRDEMFRLQSENQQLRTDLKARDDWDARKAQYPLQRTVGGAIVRASTVEPKHFVCPSCFETYREPQPLQDLGVAAGIFDCPRCKTAYHVGAPQPIRIERATSSGNAWDDDRY